MERVAPYDVLGAARVTGLGWLSLPRLRDLDGECMFCGNREPFEREVILDLSTGLWRRIDYVHGLHGIFAVANVRADFGAPDHGR